MKILLMKDVFKLGRAGDIKKVADGYARNYLLPQGLAVLATPGAVKQADRIRAKAATRREALNSELGGLAQQISELRLTFPAKAGETDKLYGSITSQQVADAVTEATTFEVKRQQLEMQPIRTLGEHPVVVRLTMDLVPEFTVIVYREGEAVPGSKQAKEEAAAAAEAEEASEVVEEVAQAEEETEEEAVAETEETEETEE